MIYLETHLEFYATNDFLLCRYILKTNKSDLQNIIVSIKVISATYDRECLMGNRGGVKPSPGNQHLTSKRLPNNQCELERTTFCIEYNIEAKVQ